MASLLGQKTLCLVTGASRGIGREIAIQLAKQLGEGSSICLAARDARMLDETLQAIRVNTNALGLGVRVSAYSIDLESAHNAEIDALLDTMAVGDERFDVLTLVHNAGTLICEKLASQFEDIEETEKYMRLNFNSAVALTSKCLTRFGRSIDRTIVVVNISSLLGIKPLSGTALYNAVKAARDFYFTTLAKEYDEKLLCFDGGAQSERPHGPVLRVLNYAPGPVVTAMARQFSELNCNPSIRENWDQRILKLVTCEQTVAKLLGLLRGNAFKSGAHIDYFDDPPTN